MKAKSAAQNAIDYVIILSLVQKWQFILSMQAPRSAIRGILAAPTPLSSGTNATETTGPDDYVIIRPLAPNQQRGDDEVSASCAEHGVLLCSLASSILHCAVFVLCIVSLAAATPGAATAGVTRSSQTCRCCEKSPAMAANPAIADLMCRC